MITGTTRTGFSFELEDEVMDDYELLEILSEIDNGDYGKVTSMVDTLLGPKQKKKLKEHIRDQHGKVSAKAMLTEVMEIFQTCQPGKNS